ncbi:hypothetical protein HDV06_002435 [Boothiomyces sp. JEL0866]|nr:hypothetical protein HDV06_002435 [Boothiomyces sp. JEL0866]
MYPRLQTLPQKKTHNLALNLYEPLPFPYFQYPFPPYTFPQNFYDKQATAIQKVFKGYKTRKQYVNNKLNPITKSKEPDQYYTEVYFFEVIKESIEATLIELCLSAYYPISNTREMKALIMLEHVVKEIVHDTCSSMMKRNESSCIFEDLLSELILEGLEETMSEKLTGYLNETKTRMIMDIIYQDNLTWTVFEILNELSAERELDQLIEDGIYDAVSEFYHEEGIPKSVSRPKPKSTLIDKKMDDMLEKYLMEEIVKNLGPRRKLKADNEIDCIMLETLFKSL